MPKKLVLKSKRIFTRGRVNLFLLLCLFWVALSGIWSPTMLLTMVACAAFTIFVVEKAGMAPNITFSKRGFAYVPYMLKSMLASSVKVIQLVSNESTHFASGVSKVEFPTLRSNTDIVMHAAAITMTPGTVVIGVDKKRKAMFVHGIDSSFLSSLPDAGATRIVNGKHEGVFGKYKLVTRLRSIMKSTYSTLKKYTRKATGAGKTKKGVGLPLLTSALETEVRKQRKSKNLLAKATKGAIRQKGGKGNSSSLLKIRNQSLLEVPKSGAVRIEHK